jgi:DNA-binding transcriptional regulator YdaS (Cro superfamily)
MTLLDYLKQFPVPERKNFAARCGTSLNYLQQVAYGNKQCGESLAINIDRESGAAVSCEELRPDCDWAYLRRGKKARVSSKQIS